MTDLTPEERTVLRRRIDFRRQMGNERVSVTLPELTALLDAADERDALAEWRDFSEAERDALAAELAHMTEARDNARAEVERLTAPRRDGLHRLLAGASEGGRVLVTLADLYAAARAAHQRTIRQEARR